MSRLPKFNSDFLNRLCRRLEERGKALSRHGQFTWESQEPDEFEWLTINFQPLVGNYCIFQFVEDNRVSVFIRSNKRMNRGKVLLAIEDIKVVDNAEDIVFAIEATIAESRGFDSEDPTVTDERVRKAWSSVQVRIVNEPGTPDEPAC